MRGQRIIYSEKELAFIKNNCSLPAREQYQLFQNKFKRPEIAIENFNGLRKRKGWLTGRTGRFEKGHDGYKGGPKGPNKTSFKKGSIPANLKPLYSERTTKDGYIEIKVPEKNPHTGAPTRYRLKHQWVWEQKNSQVQDGYMLRFINGNRSDCRLDNLEVIPKGVNAIMNKNQYSSLPDEIKPAVKTLAKLQYRQREIQEKNQQREN